LKGENMRILVVGAIQGGTVPIGRAVYSAFNAAGQQADFLDYSDLLDEFTQIWAAKDPEQSNQFYLRLKTRLLERVVHFQPDVIFGMAQSPLNDSEILARFREAGIKLCYWFVEDFNLFTYWQNIAPSFDYFFTIQKDDFWKLLAQMGCQNYHYLPLAFDSNLEGPVEDNKPRMAISFMGAPYPNRVNFFGKLAGRDFHIYGEGWDKYTNPAIAIGDRRITEKESQGIYLRSDININLHSSALANELGRGDFVNPRTFELAGLGAFQLTDMRRLLTSHFNPADEVLALSSWNDMERAVDYFIENEAERKAIAKRAQARVLREHTYNHRAQEILSIL